MLDTLILVAEKFGIIAVVCGYALYQTQKMQTWIQDEAMKEARENSQRIENICIALINAQKKHTIDLKGLNKSYESLVTIIQKLSGNGLKDKFK
tara:strand:- start:134 stop:415 length:282 start_codon:yes stop_codon:yes gene_type:complete